MEKQSLIKYYCALLLVTLLFAGANNAAAIGQNTPQPTISPSSTPLVSKKPNTTSDNMWFPIILSILALAASGGAIALSILKNKKINYSLDSLDKKYNSKLESLEKKYTELLDAQKTSRYHQQRETISRSSAASSNTNVYLETSIDSLSERISKIENKLQVSRINEQSSNYSKNTYSYNQSHYLETDINLFSQSDITQPSEDLAYIELVNTYNANPKLLEQKAVKVSESTDSINRRHSDSSQKIVLEQANNPNYWVIHDDVGINYWLLPKSKLKIDQYRYETTKALFECRDYQPECSSFKLVKPAKVIPVSVDEQSWQLEEPGILEFILDS